MVSEPRTDSAGNVVEVGDIVASFPKSGGYTIAKVTGVFPSGRVTGKQACERLVYAYEEGAPDVEREGTRYVEDREAQGRYDTWTRGWRYPMKAEKYTYMAKDYTVVGKKKYWYKGQLADISLLILVKHDGTQVHNLVADVNQNWDAEVPE